jgi:phosphonate transport system permease protein
MGPFPGTLAPTVHSTGVLGKLYGETLEAVSTRPVEALVATDASGFQGFLFGRVPQVMSSFTSLTLYQ